VINRNPEQDFQALLHARILSAQMTPIAVALFGMVYVRQVLRLNPPALHAYPLVEADQAVIQVLSTQLSRLHVTEHRKHMARALMQASTINLICPVGQTTRLEAASALII